MERNRPRDLITEMMRSVSLSKAELIVAYREANGSFGHVDELVKVKGVGIKTVDSNRGMILRLNDLLDSPDTAEIDDKMALQNNQSPTH